MRHVILVGIEVIFIEMQKTNNHCIINYEAKYMATSHCTRDVTWFRQLSKYLRFVQEGATFINNIHQRCIMLVKNPMHHLCTDTSFYCNKLENS